MFSNCEASISLEDGVADGSRDARTFAMLFTSSER